MAMMTPEGWGVLARKKQTAQAALQDLMWAVNQMGMEGEIEIEMIVQHITGQEKPVRMPMLDVKLKKRL